MGMSASQARLLSLTARMHDLEFQAQTLQYAKLDLVDSKQDVYEEYLGALDSTKYQMSFLTVDGSKQFKDITYTNMISANVGAYHDMYTVTNVKTGQILLPEQIASKLGPDPRHPDPIKESINPLKADGTEKTHEEKLDEYLATVGRTKIYPNGTDKNGVALTSDADYIAAMKSDGSYSYWKAQFYNEMPDENDFLLVVAKNYLYTSRIDITEDDDYISQMKSDGNYDYWRTIYRQIIGYTDSDGKIYTGRGFCPISKENAVDREWLEEALNSGEVQIWKMTKEQSFFDDTNEKVNIFAESSLGTDPDLAEVANDELIQLAEVKYEKAIDDINTKETKLDLQLSRIDAQHHALKTEFDSVKQIVSKNIDRSFKTFNA